jgi:hypothetical protein
MLLAAPEMPEVTKSGVYTVRMPTGPQLRLKMRDEDKRLRYPDEPKDKAKQPIPNMSGPKLSTADGQNLEEVRIPCLRPVPS